MVLMSNDFEVLKRVYGGKQAALAEILGLTQEHASRVATGKKPVPTYVSLIVELLEALPYKDWPERWRK